MLSSFFGKEGLTLTSANHIANLAKEYVRNVERNLNSVSFYSTELTIIGSDTLQLIHSGWVECQLVHTEEHLLSISEAHALIAWLREAIKEHERMMARAQSLSLGEYLLQTGRTMPEAPKCLSSISKEDYIAALSVKERNRILALQAKASVIGKYIHPDGKFAEARKELHDKLNNPNAVDGGGRDTLIYHYTPTVDPFKAEGIFYELQQLHRSTQAELNGYLHKIDMAVQKDAEEKASAYRKAKSEYTAQMAKLTEELEDVIEARLDELRQLRIIIPNELKGIYETVSVLGKK